MSALDTQIQTLQADIGLLHQIVHGDSSTTVTTDSGPLPSFRKYQTDNLGTLIAESTELKDEAATSASNASTSAGQAAASAAAASGSEGTAAQHVVDAEAQVTLATTQASAAATSAAAAGVSASNASGSATAANASAVTAGNAQSAAQGYAVAASGSADVASANASNTLTAVAAAVAQASLAQSYAASASSVVQQDLSAVTAQALHRSPNAIASMFVYDTSRDDDGGAWTDHTQHTSWYNEALNGTWLPGGFASEMDARDYFGSVAQGAANLLTGDDSTFTTTIGGWTLNNTNATLSWQSTGRMRITQTAGVGVTWTANRQVPTVVGQRYRIEVKRPAKSGAGGFQVGAGTALGSNNLAAVAAGTTAGLDPFPVSFVATTTTTFINLQGSVTWNPGDYVEVDDVMVKAVNLAVNPSSAYYLSNADGKCYRLWKNLLSFSDDLTQGINATFNAIVSPNVIAAPDGTLRADKVIATTAANTQHWLNKTTGFFAGVTYTYTVFAKAAEFSKFSCFGSGGLGIGSCTFDLSAGTCAPTGGSSATITADPRGNGWYICTFTFTPTGGGNLYTCQLINAASTATFTGDNVSGMYFVDLQVEIGSVFTTLESKAGVADTSQGETFTGNSAKAPRLQGIVAETAATNSLTIYDLTKPGNPMWKRIKTTTAPAPFNQFWRDTNRNITCLTAKNGLILAGVSSGSTSDGSGGLMGIDFAGDSLVRWNSTTSAPPTAFGRWQGAVAQRNSTTLGTPTPLPLIGGAEVFSVAMYVEPNAPSDPVTRLPVSTIAVLTNAGLTVLKNDGVSVSNHTFSSATTDGVTIANGWMMYGNATNVWGVRVIRLADITGTTFTGTAFAAGGMATGARGSRVCGNFGTYIAANGLAGTPSDPPLSLLKLNPSAVNSSMRASIAYGYNSGWMIGDIRRCMMADVVTTTPGVELVNDGTFDTGNAALWSIQDGNVSRTVSGGAMTVTTNVSAGSDYVYQSINCDPGSQIDVSATYVLGTAATGAYFEARDGSDTGSALFSTTGNSTVGTANTAASGTITASFTPTGNTMSLRLRMIKSTNAATITWDNVSAKTRVTDRSYKAVNSKAIGTLTRTAVAAAAQLVAYSNFTNDPAQTTELVPNGTFTTDISGWGALNAATIAWDSTSGGRISITPLNGNAYGAAQINPTNLVAGRTYVLTFDVTSAAATSVQVNSQTVAAAAVRSGTGFQFLFTATTTAMTLNLIVNSSTGVVGYFDNVSIKPFTAVSSAANVVQEAYNADYDPGTGALRVAGWVLVPTTLPTSSFPEATGVELTTNGTFDVDASWTKSSQGTGTAPTISGGFLNLPCTDLSNYGYASQSFAVTIGKVYRVTVTAGAGGNVQLRVGNSANNAAAATLTINASSSASMFFAATASPQFFTLEGVSVGATSTVDSITVKEVSMACFFDRSSYSGAYYRAGVNGVGQFAVEVFDGTTTRTVTSTTAYNNGSFAKVALLYDGFGTVSLVVNGAVAASTGGAALATLTNANAIATYGNRRTLDAAWPGSVALVKVGMTAPSTNQTKFAYAQEAEMFRAGAQVSLLDNTNVLDMVFDELEDKLKVVTAANEASFVGLVRVTAASVSMGTFSKAALHSGVKLLARATINPGVDVTIPAYGLREELVNRAERAAALARSPIVVDFDTIGFTATTANGSSTLTSVAVTTGTPYLGMGISGTGIPAGTTITNINGATYTISNAATAAGTTVAMGQTTYSLPSGDTIRFVSSARQGQREGAAKDWTRNYDGFQETAAFGVSPGNAAWVQVEALRA